MEVNSLRRLFFFPEIPGNDSGYRIAVKYDFRSFSFTPDDVLVFWTTDTLKPLPELELLKNKGVVIILIKRRQKTIDRITELMHLNHPAFFSSRDKMDHQYVQSGYDFVYCGDAGFYTFVKKNLRYKTLEVRFHNLWYKILIRKQIHHFKSGLKYFLNILYNVRFEKQIFRDNLAFKTFITRSDELFYKSVSGKNDCRVYPELNGETERITPDNPIPHTSILNNGSFNFIWFGTVSTHVKDGITWFIKKVYSVLLSNGYPVTFNLYGEGTLKFSDQARKIYGHGRLNGNNIPDSGKGLFINPDLSGGGLKLKIGYFLERNLRFISTPFGMDGYETYVVRENVIVASPMEWLAKITDLIIDGQNNRGSCN